MPDNDLHSDGWRQGSIIAATLTAHKFTFDGTDLTDTITTHDTWVLCSQDCDLHATDKNNTVRCFELRPLRPREKVHIEGIRSRIMLVTDTHIVESDGPKVHVTAQALTALRDKRLDPPADERRRQFKTWLGLRYDRPAVPTEWLELCKRIQSLVEKTRPASLGFRDVLVNFVDNAPTVDVRIFVVLRRSSDRDLAMDWLATLVGLLADEGIRVDDHQAEDSTQTSLAVIESYYGLYSTELSATAIDPEHRI